MKYAIITVRADSTRLPKKCFLDLDGRTVLEHVIYRCIAFGFEPVVSTTYFDTEIMEYCAKRGVKCHAGWTKDKLQRWLDTCDKFSIDAFVTVDCDDPFFDKTLAHGALELAMNVDAVIAPDMRAFIGAMGWAMKTSILRTICEKKQSAETEMIWKHFPSDLVVKTYDADPWCAEDMLRLTLDYEEDYWIIKTLVRELGPLAERSEIVNFVDSRPGIVLINYFRNEQWKLNQQNA